MALALEEEEVEGREEDDDDEEEEETFLGGTDDGVDNFAPGSSSLFLLLRTVPTVLACIKAIKDGFASSSGYDSSI